MGAADRPGHPSVANLLVLQDKLDGIFEELRGAILHAVEKHGPMASPHEGHSVLREEVEELWEHVRADTGRTPEARVEAMQVAAMGIRYALDLC